MMSPKVWESLPSPSSSPFFLSFLFSFLVPLEKRRFFLPGGHCCTATLSGRLSHAQRWCVKLGQLHSLLAWCISGGHRAERLRSLRCRHL